MSTGGLCQRVAERLPLQAAEALAQKNYERSQRLYSSGGVGSQTETGEAGAVNAKRDPRKRTMLCAAKKTHWKRLLAYRADVSADRSEDADMIPIKLRQADGFCRRTSRRSDHLAIKRMPSLSASQSPLDAGLGRCYNSVQVRLGQLVTSRCGCTEATYAAKITNLGQEFDPVTRLMQCASILETRISPSPEMLASAEFTTGDGIPAVLVPRKPFTVNGEMFSLFA